MLKIEISVWKNIEKREEKRRDRIFIMWFCARVMKAF